MSNEAVISEHDDPKWIAQKTEWIRTRFQTKVSEFTDCSIELDFPSYESQKGQLQNGRRFAKGIRIAKDFEEHDFFQCIDRLSYYMADLLKNEYSNSKKLNIVVEEPVFSLVKQEDINLDQFPNFIGVSGDFLMWLFTAWVLVVE